MSASRFLRFVVAVSGLLISAGVAWGQCVPDPPSGSRTSKLSIGCGDLSQRAAYPEPAGSARIDAGFALRQPLMAVVSWRMSLPEIKASVGESTRPVKGAWLTRTRRAPALKQR